MAIPVEDRSVRGVQWRRPKGRDRRELVIDGKNGEPVTLTGLQFLDLARVPKDLAKDGLGEHRLDVGRQYRLDHWQCCNQACNCHDHRTCGNDADACVGKFLAVERAHKSFDFS